MAFPDLVLASIDTISVVLNDTLGGYLEVFDFENINNARKFSIGDINADGSPDILSEDGYLTGHFNDGSGDFSYRVVIGGANFDPVSVYLADMNNDNTADFISRRDNGWIYIHLNEMSIYNGN